MGRKKRLSRKKDERYAVEQRSLRSKSWVFRGSFKKAADARKRQKYLDKQKSAYYQKSRIIIKQKEKWER